MCDSELAREYRREEIEAYLAELRLSSRGDRIRKITAPVAALCKTLLQTFRELPLEKFMIVGKQSK
jgi:hypothetical protein